MTDKKVTQIKKCAVDGCKAKHGHGWLAIGGVNYCPEHHHTAKPCKYCYGDAGGCTGECGK
jgi:hypothetical protein